MSVVYCKICGQPTEYSALANKPGFCSNCGKPLGIVNFIATPVTSIPVPTKPINPVVHSRRGQPVDDDGPPEFENQDAQALAASFGRGIIVNTSKTKVTIEEAIKDQSFGSRSSGGRQTVSVEGVEVKNNDQPYACLDPKQFANRPQQLSVKAPPKPRKTRAKKNG